MGSFTATLIEYVTIIPIGNTSIKGFCFKKSTQIIFFFFGFDKTFFDTIWILITIQINMVKMMINFEFKASSIQKESITFFKCIFYIAISFKIKRGIKILKFERSFHIFSILLFNKDSKYKGSSKYVSRLR